MNTSHRRNVIIIALAALLVTLLLTLYFIQMIYYSNTGITAQSSVINGLQLFLTLRPKTNTIKQGQDINVTLELTNVSHNTLSFSFDTPYPYFRFDVRDNNSILVFTAEDDGQFSGTTTLAPERSIRETFYWDTAYRYPVAVGVYQIVGFFVTEPNSTSVFRTAPLYITIVNGSSTKTSNLQ